MATRSGSRENAFAGRKPGVAALEMREENLLRVRQRDPGASGRRLAGRKE
jgi:hypothetical protein